MADPAQKMPLTAQLLGQKHKATYLSTVTMSDCVGDT